MEMKCHAELALVAGILSQHEHELRSRLGRAVSYSLHN
jgi:hypothetical protein